VSLTRSQAFCKSTLSNAERTFAVEDWQKFHLDRISISTDDFSKLIEFIERSCAIHRDCTFEDKNVLTKAKELLGEK
jgi:hypothetical protein